MDGLTDGHRLDSHPISSQRAFSSGELTINGLFFIHHLCDITQYHTVLSIFSGICKIQGRGGAKKTRKFFHMYHQWAMTKENMI